jgi:hypothetical protein
MYLQNKYTRWYYSIITNASTRTATPSSYKERHHIIPRCLGGNNESNNLVDLTAREHFICHLLLTKMVDKTVRSKMTYALWTMANLENKNQAGKRYKVSSRIYQQIRQMVSIENSGAGHSQAKTYKVTKPDGSTCIVNHLKGFCKEHNFNYDQVLRLIRDHRTGQSGPLENWSFVDINSPDYNKPLNEKKIYGNRKSYSVISPSGKSFTVVGALEAFCKEYNLDLTTMQKICKTQKPAQRGNCVGWRISPA